jgi:hypothetical protein
MIWNVKALGVGNSSRQGAKPSLEGKDEKVLPMILIRDLRPLQPLRSFDSAQDMPCGDIPRFGCCFAAPGYA